MRGHAHSRAPSMAKFGHNPSFARSFQFALKPAFSRRSAVLK